ncbi:hypothetical protein DICVIV_04239 [Dictyocaulus viviparus]|uniref:L-Fucosyltransferase n=1 Tax=Dictyocaulus viviparus TaxID=29172 RepID=A0A0D8Y0Q1_DICVI|nr:hypothetical protein DICVIV_04239 [Dictyocaulus viviparus]
MAKTAIYWYVLICIIIIQCFFFFWYRKHLEKANVTSERQKYVGFHLNYGRLGNQLFHLITGYGIARTLSRIHYLPYEGPRAHVTKYLKIFDQAFPNLRHTYILSTNDTNQTTVPFASGSCCNYDNPNRLLNHSAEYLLLNFIYGQNPHYFDEYLSEIRELLRFSNNARNLGEKLIGTFNNETERTNMLCLHIRMTDFIVRNISTDTQKTTEAANDIANKNDILRFIIFGDDQDFMRRLSKEIIQHGKWKTDAVIVSQFNEVTDLYVASQVCRSFLITAVTSTFGWWLAFFVPNQKSVFYMSDNRAHADKVPSKELFLSTWQKYDVE